MPTTPYYRRDLALVHHEGFGFHADACAPGILALLEGIVGRGVVLELGCGSGLLTRHLVAAGHRVIATDASTAMLELARQQASGAEDIRQLVLPDDPLPPADAIVSVGHVLNYLPDQAAIERALVAVARALEPGGMVAIDLCDLEWGRARADAPPIVRRTDDWALMTEFDTPSPQRFVRRMTTFVRNPDGTWRRDDETHDNVLVDTASVPRLLAEHHIEASVRPSFGREEFPVGLVALVGNRC
jgi:SAM-dependent methyltransferase